jgi:hypothetical protein
MIGDGGVVVVLVVGFLVDHTHLSTFASSAGLVDAHSACLLFRGRDAFRNPTLISSIFGASTTLESD